VRAEPRSHGWNSKKAINVQSGHSVLMESRNIIAVNSLHFCERLQPVVQKNTVLRECPRKKL
jgi:hypothetical protein